MGLAEPLWMRCLILPREKEGQLDKGSRPTRHSPLLASGWSGPCTQDGTKGSSLPTWHCLPGTQEGRDDHGWSPASLIDPPRPMQTPDPGPPPLSLIVGSIHQQLGLCNAAPKNRGLHCPGGSCSEGRGLRVQGGHSAPRPKHFPSIALLLVCSRGCYLKQCPHRAGPG